MRRRWTIRVDYVEDWLLSLDGSSYELVVAALELLEERGPALGRPLVDRIQESRHQNMKELRPGSSGRSELRILFAFDRYQEAIPEADRLLDRHSAARGNEGDRG